MASREYSARSWERRSRRRACSLVLAREDRGREWIRGKSRSWKLEHASAVPFNLRGNIFGGVRRLSSVFYKVVTKVALIFTVAASFWQRARPGKYCSVGLIRLVSRPIPEKSSQSPALADRLCGAGVRACGLGEISYSQSEEFTVCAPEIRVRRYTHTHCRDETGFWEIRVWSARALASAHPYPRHASRDSDFHRRFRKHKLKPRFPGRDEEQGGGGSANFAYRKTILQLGRFNVCF